MSSSFANRLGIEHPLIQAPRSGSTPPALVAAVSNAGALGSLGAGYLEPPAIIEQAAERDTEKCAVSYCRCGRVSGHGGSPLRPPAQPGNCRECCSTEILAKCNA